jgi:hypothetical protein
MCICIVRCNVLSYFAHAYLRVNTLFFMCVLLIIQNAVLYLIGCTWQCWSTWRERFRGKIKLMYTRIRQGVVERAQTPLLKVPLGGGGGGGGGSG